MLKIKKVLSVLLSLLMIFGSFSVAAFAATSISDVSIEVNIEEGMTPDDIEEFISLPDGLELDCDDGNIPIYVYDSETGAPLDEGSAFENNVAYDIDIYLKPSEGYSIDDTIKYVTVNGQKTDDFYAFAGEDGFVDIYLDDFVINAEPYTGTPIEKAEIKIDTDIAGLYVNDYEFYIHILTQALQFEDNYEDPAVFVYDENGDQVYHQFKSGETYSFFVYLAPNEGRRLSGYVEGYVNGEEVSTYTSYWYPDSENGEVKVDYVELNFEITVEGEKQLTIFERIINFFRNLFDKIISLFSFQPSPVK